MEETQAISGTEPGGAWQECDGICRSQRVKERQAGSGAQQSRQGSRNDVISISLEVQTCSGALPLPRKLDMLYKIPVPEGSTLRNLLGCSAGSIKC